MVESSGAMAPGRCYDQEDIESPAYSLGGHETAGFCAVVFGRQPGKAGLLNRSEWDNTHSGDGVNAPAVLFSPLNLWSPVGVNPRKMGESPIFCAAAALMGKETGARLTACGRGGENCDATALPLRVHPR